MVVEWLACTGTVSRPFIPDSSRMTSCLYFEKVGIRALYMYSQLRVFPLVIIVLANQSESSQAIDFLSQSTSRDMGRWEQQLNCLLNLAEVVRLNGTSSPWPVGTKNGTPSRARLA